MVRILRIFSIVLITLLVILFLLSLFLQNRVGAIVLHSLNNSLQTKIETRSYRLSFIRKFPKATVELKDVWAHSSPGFDISTFEGINTDTLLKAQSASVDLRMTDLLRGVYTFTKITIRSGNLNIFTDQKGNCNYNISGGGPKKSDEDLILNFKKIYASDLRFVYNDHRPGLIIKGLIRNGRFKTSVRNEIIDFEGNSDIRIDLFNLKNTVFQHSIPASLEVSLNKNPKGIFFKKSVMKIENWDFIMNGYVASDNYIELNINAGNIDISKIENLLADDQKKRVANFNPNGVLKFGCAIKGKSSTTENPQYNLNWSLKDARITSRSSRLKLDNLAFDGEYTNGPAKSPETSSLSIRNFTSRLGSSDYTGSLSIKNFKNPNASLTFRGRLLLRELSDFLDLKNVSRAGGSVDLDLNFSGTPGRMESFMLKNIFSLNSSSEIIFNSVVLSIDNKHIDINNASGKVSLKDNRTSSENLNLYLNNHKVTLSGSLNEFPGWLTGNPVALSGNLSVTTSCFRPESFMNTEAENNKNANKVAVKLPDDIFIDVNYRIDTLEYKKFDARNIKGSLSIKPGNIIIRNVSFNSQEGKISGNGLVVQNPNKSFIGRGSFSVTGVDVNKAFNTFNNFGQNFLKAENLAGSLSGSITLLLPADSLLNPDVRSITAEGKYSILNGSLINFDPVKALSKFISLSELENIKFEELRNDFFIRSNVFYVPQMDINSSAADLTVNGKHSFDNEYEYHVKMHLSEILSKKARKNRSLRDDFGEIEDDGLGRTSVYLLLEGKGEVVDVSYDMKAQSSEIKENIKKEKENLRTIFNEEYRLNKNGNEPAKKQDSKPRFRIKWDGSSDTTAIQKEPEEERKETFLDRLFKKN